MVNLSSALRKLDTSTEQLEADEIKLVLKYIKTSLDNLTNRINSLEE